MKQPTIKTLNLEERLKALRAQYAEIQAEAFKLRKEAYSAYGNPSGWGAVTAAALVKDWRACQLLWGVERLFNDDETALTGDPLKRLDEALAFDENVAKENVRGYLEGYFEGQASQVLGEEA